MGDITLLELHTHGDSQFGPSSMSRKGSEESSAKDAASKAKSLLGTAGTDEDDREHTDVGTGGPNDGSDGGSIGTLVMGLVLLVGIAMAAKKFRGRTQAKVDLSESDDR